MANLSSRKLAAVRENVKKATDAARTSPNRRSPEKLAACKRNLELANRSPEKGIAASNNLRKAREVAWRLPRSPSQIVANAANLEKARAAALKSPKRLEAVRQWRNSPENIEHLSKIAKMDTRPELIVKAKLDQLGVRYIHPYILNGKFNVDFYLPDFNTIIEVDGCYWHRCTECGYGEGRARDRSRNAYILKCGYNLEIVWEHELGG